jgi:hypothetical protein
MLQPRQPTEWKKIFGSHVYAFFDRMHRELKKLNSKISEPMKKWEMIL